MSTARAGRRPARPRTKMREQLTSQLRKIVRALEVRSPESFTFAGRVFSLAEAGHAHQPQGFAQAPSKVRQ
jgi:hypothetical protein